MPERNDDDQRGPLFRLLGFLFGWAGPTVARFLTWWNR